MGRGTFTAEKPVEQFFQYSLLGLVTSGYLAVLGSGFLDLPTAIFAGLGLLLRGLLVAGVFKYEFSPTWVNAATLAYVGFYPVDYFYISRALIPATVHLIFFLAVVRILTARTNRDYFFVKVIAVLELLAATLLSTSLNFLAFLVMFVVFGVATFCCSEIRKAAQSGRRVAGTPHRFSWRLAGLTASLTLAIGFMTGGLFFLLPRTAQAALRNLVPYRYHLPGFSNQVTLGEIGEIKQQSTPVMHVRVELPPQEQSSLKWRGATLSHFDGRRWSNPFARPELIRVTSGQAILVPAPRLHREGRRVMYDVNINSVDTNVLFFAGSPERLQINASSILRGPGGTYRTGSPMPGTGLSYTAYANLDGETGGYRDELPPENHADVLALPPLDERIPKLAARLTSGQRPWEKARTIERYLRTQHGYTMQLLDKPVADPLAHFLFERKQGHCEYFASAMAVMLRAVRIPSRVVTGFQGGVHNPMTGWQIIRASDAHSWVEAYLPETGWTVFDPTPPDPNAKVTSPLLAQLALYLDAADTFWQQWVMNYDLDRQVSLASRIDRTRAGLDGAWVQRISSGVHTLIDRSREQGHRYAALGSILLFLGCGIVVCGPRCWNALRARSQVRRLSRGQIAPSDAGVLYGRMLKVLRKRGYEKPAWLTPHEFARILPESQYSSAVWQITALYHELRFGGDSEAGIRMLHRIQQLEQQR